MRNGYREIRVVFEIKGDLTPAQKAELMAMGQAYSPVFDIVSHGVLVSGRPGETEAMPMLAAK